MRLHNVVFYIQLVLWLHYINICVALNATVLIDSLRSPLSLILPPGWLLLNPDILIILEEHRLGILPFFPLLLSVGLLHLKVLLIHQELVQRWLRTSKVLLWRLLWAPLDFLGLRRFLCLWHACRDTADRLGIWLVLYEHSLFTSLASRMRDHFTLYASSRELIIRRGVPHHQLS